MKIKICKDFSTFLTTTYLQPIIKVTNTNNQIAKILFDFKKRKKKNSFKKLG
jgi:hypothetical protein